MRWSWVTSLLLAALMAASIPLCLVSGEQAQRAPTVDEAKAAMSAQEWKQVAKQRKPDKRVRKLLEVATRRLKQAQQLAAQEAYAGTPRLLKQYSIMISYAIAFIEGLPEKQRKRRRNAYKEFDVHVRKQIQMLEELERALPIGFQEVPDALYTARRLRIIALNGFSGAEIIKVPKERP